jgi:hypothetical protein
MIGQQERDRVRLTEDVGQLVGAVARVQGDHDDAERGGGVLRHEPQRPVRQPDGERVALAEAERGEAAGEGARAVAQRREGETVAVEDDRLARGMARGDVLEHRPRRGLRERRRAHVNRCGTGSPRSSRRRARPRRA